MSASKVEEILSKSPHLNTQVIESMLHSKHNSDSEFVSDAFQSSNDNENDLEEIKDGMRRLGIDSMTQVRQSQLSAQAQQTILSNDGKKNFVFSFLFLHIYYFTFFLRNCICFHFIFSY